MGSILLSAVSTGTNKTMGVISKSVFCVLLTASYALGAESDSTALKADEGTGKIYFTGPGYTVNLIPHALVLGLLGLALVILYGDSLLGSTTSDAVATGYGAPEPSYGAPAPSYDAPSTGYNAANRYYDERAANAAS